jgi:hypothetical protein
MAFNMAAFSGNLAGGRGNPGGKPTGPGAR